MLTSGKELMSGTRIFGAGRAAAAVILMFTAGCASSSKTINWDETGPSARGKIHLEELDQTTVQNMKAVVYKIRVSGLRPGERFSLWGKKLNAMPVPVSRVGLYPDEQGRLIARIPPPEIAMPSGSSINLEGQGKEFVFKAAGFARGEPFELSLLDSERNVRAFIRVVPFPIVSAGDGPCRLWVELASPAGDLFSILGNGFNPSEEVRTVSQSETSIFENTRRVTPQGDFKAAVLPMVPGKVSGNAEYRVTGQSCTASVQYAWGSAALQPE